ncbi:hypothetical protein HPB51_022989 [Rhipicephalus microplus]|uniref:Tick transposon n=1 Tax=Rhipicephalus microplus TaxID=6941 RepID=A0A9J6DCU5_RHIMP|nr:hypothetical protein HPB51_022989 [Rhipicephalus microplus]
MGVFGRVESSVGDGPRTVSRLSPAFAAYRADEMTRTFWNIAQKVFNRAAEMRDQEEKTEVSARNITPGNDDERRTAWAEAMTRKLEENPRILHADSDRVVVVVTYTDRLIVSASLRTTEPAIAEEAAMALALVQPSVDVVVTNSKTVCGLFRREVISSKARAILSKCKLPGRAVKLVWVPAHSQLAGNTIADYHAGEMSIRAEHKPENLLHLVTSFRGITQMYQKERCQLPEPHTNLTRKQHTIMRLAHAASLAPPVLLNRMDPEEHHTLCPFCKIENGTLPHILVQCTEINLPPTTFASPRHRVPQPLERWETLLSSSALPTQRALTNRGGARSCWTHAGPATREPPRLVPAHTTYIVGPCNFSFIIKSSELQIGHEADFEEYVLLLH